jgi:hypothetical protein
VRLLGQVDDQPVEAAGVGAGLQFGVAAYGAHSAVDAGLGTSSTAFGSTCKRRSDAPYRSARLAPQRSAWWESSEKSSGTKMGRTAMAITS